MPTTTPNLEITHLQPSQSQPDIPVNAALDVLDQAQTALLAKTITSADVTLTATVGVIPGEAETTLYVRVTGVFTGNRNLIVPAKNKLYIVEHSGTGGHTLTVKTPSGTGVTINQGTTQAVYSDGTSIVPVTGATGAGGASFILGGTFMGKPGDSAVLAIIPVGFALRMPAGLTNSRIYAADAPSDGDATISIRVNGVEVGTATIALGAHEATFTMASNTDTDTPDIVTFVAPTPQDSTLADLGIWIQATKL